MPITVTVPTSPWVGPGVNIQWGSDLIGPMPTGSFWEISVLDSSEGRVMLQQATWTSMSQNIYLGWESSISFVFPAEAGVQLGDSVSVSINLHNGATGNVDDSGTLTGLTWDPVMQLYQLTRLNGPASTGAFTSEDRSNLEATMAATRVSIPAVGAVGGAVLRGLGELFGSVPEQFTNRHGSILVSGQGSLARGTEPFRSDALGIEWHWNTIPAGFGRTLGSVDEYGRRIVQWRLIDQDDSGQLFQRGYVDSSAEGERFVWGVHSPVTLEWFVAPGCIVELSFLVLVLG